MAAGMNDQAGAPQQTTSQKIGAWLSDPETRKAIASLVGSGGKFMEDISSAPPHVQEMMKKVIGGGQGGGTNQVGGTGPAPDPMNPYGGDMAKYITPEMARGVLDAHGIPYGRMTPLV